MTDTPLKRIEGFQWDMQKLLDPQGWKMEARRAQEAGIDAAATIGVACPRCWLPIAPNGNTSPKHCACEDRTYDSAETLEALGLEGRTISTNDEKRF